MSNMVILRNLYELMKWCDILPISLCLFLILNILPIWYVMRHPGSERNSYKQKCGAKVAMW